VEGTLSALSRKEATMVATRRVFGSFSVDDIDAARRFYGDTLGMRVSAVTDGGPLWLQGPGGQDTLVYLKPDHAPASFTVLNLSVDGAEQAVDELTERGVRFERYEGLETDERGIYRDERHAIAWFTDPAGNILSVVQEG
jgi:catechol 2,3-dioxygenase-like lactoylglutathione lyase family enzyme